MGELFSVAGKTAVCRQVAEELSRAGECLALPADLSSEAACRRLAAEVAERQDRLQVLVNNAGATWGAPLEEYPAAAWDKVLDLNLKMPFFLTRAMLPLLEAAAGPGDPADPGAGPGAGAAGDHRERDRAGSVRVQDDGRDPAAVR
jgi:NAD(P)-dependent dehydrogenase (short-subunit alcohol dehydrogenase family)